ncbi:MAG: N-methylhydantoinase [Actinomycetota bacterium]|nr:N-methylhydantoinase [Actinomycetota bacterium]
MKGRYALGVDVGGTFTDLFAIGDAGETLIEKVPSTPGDQSVGVIDGIERLADLVELRVEDFVPRIDYLVHGTTVATNIMLEMNGAVTGVLATEGHRDTIDIRRNYKETDFDIRLPAPLPIAPRRRRIGVRERVNAGGEVVIPLDEASVRAAVEQLRAQEVEAIAVCFLFSFLNPAHELRTRELIAEVDPEIHVSLSHEVLPRVREFERLSTTLVDAYVTPDLRRYLHRLRAALAGRGFEGELFIMAANGGMVSVDHASRRGVELVLSGPAGGTVAGVGLGEDAKAPNVITVDMGGTSFDICMIRDGQPEVSTEAWMNRYRVAVPTLDIQTIGAGGGSIAWVDEGRKLRVGPQSSRAVPGPVCYGKGGTEPTVTDADLVLGRIAAGSVMGGGVRLDLDAATRAMATKIAEPLGTTAVAAASGVLRVVNSNMANGIAEVAMKRGHDPRDFALVAFGGAGPVHAAAVAAELGMWRVLIPRDKASVFSAYGCVLSDVRISKSRGLYARSSNLDVEWLAGLLPQTLDEARAEIEGIDSIVSTRTDVLFEMHYKLQTHEIMVPAALPQSGDMTLTAEAVDATFARFHEIHEQLFSFKKPEQEVELLGLQVDLWGLRDKPRAAPAASLANGARPTPTGYRRVYFDELGGFEDETPVFQGVAIGVDQVVEGPAIVEEPHTTIVVHPQMSLRAIDHSVYELKVR